MEIKFIISNKNEFILLKLIMKEEDFFDSEIAFINSERPDTEKQKNFKKKND